MPLHHVQLPPKTSDNPPEQCDVSQRGLVVDLPPHVECTVLPGEYGDIQGVVDEKHIRKNSIYLTLGPRARVTTIHHFITAVLMEYEEDIGVFKQLAIELPEGERAVYLYIQNDQFSKLHVITDSMNQKMTIVKNGNTSRNLSLTTLADAGAEPLGRVEIGNSERAGKTEVVIFKAGRKFVPGDGVPQATVTVGKDGAWKVAVGGCAIWLTNPQSIDSLLLRDCIASFPSLELPVPKKGQSAEEYQYYLNEYLKYYLKDQKKQTPYQIPAEGPSAPTAWRIHTNASLENLHLETKEQGGAWQVLIRSGEGTPVGLIQAAPDKLKSITLHHRNGREIILPGPSAEMSAADYQAFAAQVLALNAQYQAEQAGKAAAPSGPKWTNRTGIDPRLLPQEPKGGLKV